MSGLVLSAGDVALARVGSVTVLRGQSADDELVVDSSIASRRLTGHFPAGTRESLAEILSVALHVHVRVDGRIMTLTAE
jgi:ferric-dicitrate binding protein FerR (iron transport regulator)